MKHRAFLLAFATFLSASVQAQPQQQSLQSLEQQAQTITKQFGGQLKALLQSSIISSGPESAISVCKMNAPAIAEQVRQSHGWEVARTSTKLRNPSNQADLWEAQMLAQWQEQLRQGTPLQSLKASQIVTQNGKQVYRYMKPIGVADVCLNCHGQHLSAGVKQTLQDLYPEDKATGYKKGDLRGAFTLQKTL